MDTSNAPFFSIVIPTKNRSHLVVKAVENIIKQDFIDFEVIIVDNDDTEDTFNAMQTYLKNDKRVKYFRTGNLSMPDNWEFGVSKITGKYLIIVEDKMMLKPGALLKLYNLILSTSAEVITWINEIYNTKTNELVSFKTERGKYYRISSDKILNAFINTNFRYFQANAPTGYNSCVKFEIVEKLRDGKNGRLCLPVCPDFTMAYQILSEIDTILHLSDVLATLIIGEINNSNGSSYNIKGELFIRFIKDLCMPEEYYYKYVPVKAIICNNYVINDFYTISNVIGGKLENYKLNLAKYFTCIYEDNRMRIIKGANILPEIKAWEKALASQSVLMKMEVKVFIFLQKIKRIRLRIINNTKLIMSIKGRKEVIEKLIKLKKK